MRLERLASVAGMIALAGLAGASAARADPAGLEHRFALVIGVDHYGKDEPGCDPSGGECWPRLDHAVDEAYRVASELASSHSFDSVELVVDELRERSTMPVQVHPARVNLVRAEIARSIRSFLTERGRDASARLLLWYGGHGATVDGEGFLVGSDAPLSSSPDFALHAVQVREVASWMRLAKSRHVLAVFDSCFGGTVFEPRSEARRSLEPWQMIQLPVRQFITSGSADEKVRDDESFAAAFLDGIAGSADGNLDGFVTGTELGLHLSRVIQRQTHGKQTPQFGELVDREYDLGNFVFEHADPAVASGRPMPAFVDCEECPPVVPIADEAKTGTRFALGAREVSFAEWDACVADGGCDRRPDDAGWGRGLQPAIRVSWEDASQYARWLSRKTRVAYRLPTAAEWEEGLGGSGPRRANCRGCAPAAANRPLPVGSFEANAKGLYDMRGNVWEWVQICEEPSVAQPSKRCARGGSWANDAADAGEVLLPVETRSAGVGFRVLREVGATVESGARGD